MATQPHFVGSMTLKALLEDPNLKHPPEVTQSDAIKIKKEGNTSDIPQFNYGSAFLGPNLWDGTVYDNLDFSLEYMDLDEFLSENGTQADGGSSTAPTTTAPTKIVEPQVDLNVISQPLPSPHPSLKTPPHSPRHFLSPLPTAVIPNSPSQFPTSPQPPAISAHHSTTKSPSPPVSPFQVEYQISEQDLVLASIPDNQDSSSLHYQPKWQGRSEDFKELYGQEEFDPRKRNFTEDELKPQPIIKKSKKVFVPEDLKDEKYWARRNKNNFAAKRSRDARRVKENQIAMRAAFLERENQCLHEEMAKLRKENAKLKSKVAKYEGVPAEDCMSPGGLGLP